MGRPACHTPTGRCLLLGFALCLWFVSLPLRSEDVSFDEARIAAEEGRFEDVIDILTGTLETAALEDADRVIAYSNRGIAYSLMNAFGRARQDLQSAIELDPDHALSQNHLGVLAEHVDGDYAAALRWYGMAAEQGFAASQVNVGHFHRYGRGIPKDSGLALEWYGRAADQDHGPALVALGEMYWQGVGIARDTKRAIELFQKGYERSALSAAYHLGLAREEGRGLARDPAEAARLYEEDATRGDARAQNALGYLYRRGLGVEQDFEKAAMWYEFASEQELHEATNRLAWLLATCPTPAVCNGVRALELAQQAVSADPIPGYLDTLAAAQARAGAYDEAVQTIDRAMAQSSEGSARWRAFNNRKGLYEQGRPYQMK